MERSLGGLKCGTHGNQKEVVCIACNKFLCAECISDHGSDGHSAYVHILDYCATKTIPSIDKLMEETKAVQAAVNEDGDYLAQGLPKVAAKMKDITHILRQSIGQLQKAAAQLKMYALTPIKTSYSEALMAGLQADKKKLDEAIKKKDAVLALKLTQKIEAESLTTTKQDTAASVFDSLKQAFEGLGDIKRYAPVLYASNLLVAKCQYLRMVSYTQDWKLDRQYLSTKMFISEDSLTYGCTASSGYPGIIGTVGLDSGSFAYEVIPTHLECTGKEGFGIIEREKYVAAYNKDKTTPTIHDEIIGYMYKNEAKRMTIQQMSEMQLEAKYYVWANLVELKVVIIGPSLRLTATLTAGVTYVPCFSCGCANNRLKIRPLSSFDEIPGYYTQPHSHFSL